MKKGEGTNVGSSGKKSLSAREERSTIFAGVENIIDCEKPPMGRERKTQTE